MRENRPNDPPVVLKAGFARTVQCPRCKHEFDTPRRWEFECVDCGHKWKIESVQTWRDRVDSLLNDVLDRFTMPVMWLVVGTIVVLGFAPFFYWLWTIGASWEAILILTVFSFLAGLAGFSVCGGFRRRR